MNDNLIERLSVPIQCEREAFETWASRQQGFGCAANPVDYTLGATRDAWEVWQARAAIERQSVPQPQPAQQEPVAHFGSAYVNENGVHITTVLGPVAIPQDAKLYTSPQAQPQSVPPLELTEYDAGLLNDFGGGNVEWWQDYIRAELGRAYEHYQSQIPAQGEKQ